MYNRNRFSSSHNTIKIDSYSIVYICFLSAFLLNVSNFVVDYTRFRYFIYGLQLIGYIIGCVKFLLHSVSIKKLFFVNMIGILIIITSIQSGETILLSTFLLIIASRGVNFDNLVKFDLRFRSIGTILIIIFSKIGIVSNRIIFRENGAIDMMRESLGFSHPNRLALEILIISLDIMYIKYKKYSFKDIVVISFLLIFNVMVTDGRSSIYCQVILLIFIVFNFIFAKKVKIINSIEMIITKNAYTIFAICIGFSFYTAISYDYFSDKWAKLNTIFNARIGLAQNAIVSWGIHLLGQNISYITTVEAQINNVTNNGIDNMYVYLGVTFGGIILVIFLLFLLFDFRFVIKKGNIAATFALIIIVICGIMENQMLSAESNIFLICLGGILYKNNFYINDNIDD
ncbi:hypothetical protein [Clostridium omnivorum]|uniref:Uncharacterized protein n=1 Tax=Clostridium omnivorum TaxID=1604902 RepID=A0ABQ5N3B3_9CLOT|nr:hypothetical protein [Clostridium sp. E14]GLC29707.1 hypothetical protein bsdE14_11170 [Clostridium sp. E14]